MPKLPGGFTVNLDARPTPPSLADEGARKPNRECHFWMDLNGLFENTTVEIVFWELDETEDASRRADRELGRLKGKVFGVAPNTFGSFGFTPEGPLPSRKEILDAIQDPTEKQRAMLICISFASRQGVSSAYYRLDDQNLDKNEGDYWEVRAKAKCQLFGKDYETISSIERISRLRRVIPGSLATYPARAGNRLKLYNDGCGDPVGATGAFRDMLDAIAGAQHFVFAADWSFHPLFRPSRTGGAEAADPKTSIGLTLIGKALAGVTVAVHTWDHTNLGAPDAQNDDGDDVFGELAGGGLPPNLHWRYSSRAGASDYFTGSHHQKMLIVDTLEKDGRRGIRAFLGGLDLTKGRFDHPGHPVGPAPGNSSGDANTWAHAQTWSSGSWTVDEWYNCETGDDRTLPRQPWHDVHARLDGPSAWDYLREFVGRWLAVSGKPAKEDPIGQAYGKLFDRSQVVPMEEPLPDGTWTVQACRSREKEDWAVEESPPKLADLPPGHHASMAYRFQWRLKAAREQSILHAYRQGIDQAENFIYIENQYFIGSGKHWGYDDAQNDLPERLVNKIIERHKAQAPFHAYLVLPMFPEGAPASASLSELRSCEYETIKWMMGRLNREMGSAWERYLSFYFLANWRSVPPIQWVKDEVGIGFEDTIRWLKLKHHQRYMIYVHSKLMIVDDRYLILGSCNLNDRGLLGDGDSEIAMSAWPMLRYPDPCIAEVRDLRRRLWMEHLGMANLPGAWLAPGSEDCWKNVKKKAFKNYRAFRTMSRLGAEGHLCLWNYRVKQDELVLKEIDSNLGIRDRIEGPENDMCLPDSPYHMPERAARHGWTWRGRFKLFMPRFLVK